jgi:hypothetical protein
MSYQCVLTKSLSTLVNKVLGIRPNNIDDYIMIGVLFKRIDDNG